MDEIETAYIMIRKNYYQILGIDRDADEATIKSAYRQLARQYHPDSTDYDPAADLKFHEIDEAYEILRDPVKRAKYDANGRVEATTAPLSWRYEYQPPPVSRQTASSVPSGDSRSSVGIQLFVALCSVLFCGLLLLLTSEIGGESSPEGWSETTASVESVVRTSCDDGLPSCLNIFYRYTVNGKTYRSFILSSRYNVEQGETLAIEYRDDDPQRSVIADKTTDESIVDESVLILLMIVTALGIGFGLVEYTSRTNSRSV